MNHKKLIVDSGLKMLNGNYTVETWGNISYRDPGTNLVYLTPSGMDYTTITEDDIVVCNLSGDVVDCCRKPTIETSLHLGIYAARPNVNAIIHTHPIYSMVFACTGEDIPMIIDEAAQVLGGTCKSAEYALPGSDELAQNCLAALGETANSCLLRSHGAVCVGETMDGAFRVAKVLEITAQIYQMIKAAGKEFIPISQENIEAMQYYVANIYGQR